MNRHGKNSTPDDELELFLNTYADCGFNITATAKALFTSRSTIRRHIAVATNRGMIEPGEDRARFLGARERMFAAYQKKKLEGDWRKPVAVNLPPQPFRLKLFGDPHLDSPGSDTELFEKHFEELDRDNRIYGIWVGDAFDNWKKSLAHLWRGTGDPADAWTFFEQLMADHGHSLIGGCSGNHDDWTNAPVDPIDMVMKQHGVPYRIGAIRLALIFDSLPTMFVAIRHKWRGASIYSPSHGIVRAAIWGWNDHLMIGGHIHQDEPRMRVHPETGHVTHICQVSSFKRYDQFSDTEGHMSHRIKPVWDLVIDPRRADNDPDKIKTFWDSQAAASYLNAIR